MSIERTQIQIPFDIYMRLKPIAETVPEFAVNEFLSWGLDCYLADDTNKFVDYYLGTEICRMCMATCTMWC